MPKTEKRLEIREENSHNVKPKLESPDSGHFRHVSRRVSPETKKGRHNIREEKGKWENEVGTRRKLMKMKEQWPLTTHRRWPPENEAVDTGNSPDLQGETKLVHWVREESKTNWNKREEKGGEVAPPRCCFASPSPEKLAGISEDAGMGKRSQMRGKRGGSG